MYDSIITLMDIDLLSKMVKELILDNDRVVLPGLGTFVAEVVPAVFSDRGYTINPPYRRLHFRPGNDRDDALAILYSQANGIDRSVAGRVIEDFVAEMKEVVSQRKVVVFPGLGRLRATKENNLFFVADADLDIYPDGFGLEPISLKTHQETPEEVAEAVVDLANILDDCPAANSVPATNIVSATNVDPATNGVPATNVVPEPNVVPTSDAVPEPIVTVPEPADVVPDSIVTVTEFTDVVPEPDPFDITPEDFVVKSEELTPTSDDIIEVRDPESELGPESEPDQNTLTQSENEGLAVTVKEVTDKNKTKRVILIIILTIVITALVALGVFILLAHITPDFIDSILYTPEELEILRW